jgi:hypothetical protein
MTNDNKDFDLRLFIRSLIRAGVPNDEFNKEDINRASVDNYAVRNGNDNSYKSIAFNGKPKMYDEYDSEKELSYGTYSPDHVRLPSDKVAQTDHVITIHHIMEKK